MVMRRLTLFSHLKEKKVTDIFRKAYRELNAQEKQQLERLKDQAAALHNTITIGERTREISLAVTKLEEAVMWAVKSITA
jgi:uncharacterized protein YeaO (DUF488 family)